MCWPIDHLSPTWYPYFFSLTFISKQPSPATNPDIQFGSILANSAASTKCKGLSKISMFYISSVVLDKP